MILRTMLTYQDRPLMMMMRKLIEQYVLDFHRLNKNLTNYKLIMS